MFCAFSVAIRISVRWAFSASVVLRNRRLRRRPVLQRHIIQNKASELIGRNTTLRTFSSLLMGAPRHKDASQEGLSRASLLFDTERLQLSMQRGALHANELRGSGYVAAKATDLSHQIVPLEGFSRLAKR